MDNKISVSRRGLSIIKSDYSDSFINNVRKELTVKPFVHKNYASNNNPFPVYAESQRKLYVPRYFGIEKFGKPDINKISPGLPINIEFSKSLREIQQPIVDAYINSLDNNGGGGIISIPCGYGKTVISLYILSKLKVKTLIIVHKEFLMNQWKERINEFLPDSKIGKIKASIIKIKDTQIVLGMLQSISMKEYDPKLFDEFGLVIFDECHHLGAEVFSKALAKTNCKYTLGLSATPKRDDGLSKVFEWYLGPIIYQIKKRDIEEVNVKIVKYCSEDEKYCKEEKNFKGLLNTSKMINNVCNFEPRTNIIINLLLDTAKENRKILVLSNRIDLLKNIHEKINNSYSCGYYLGGMKEKELNKSIENNIILATFSMAEEGFDCKELDTVVLASPKSKIEQAVGRILRKKAEDRTKIPLVIDIFDEFSSFNKQNIKRCKYYKKNKYNIEYINRNPTFQLEDSVTELDFIK